MIVHPRQAAFGGTAFSVVDDKETFWERFNAGTWEPETLAALARLVGPGTLLIDIGAWVGPISLVAAALGADVMAFEPDSRAFELLDANVGANASLEGRLTLVNKAVAPVEGPIRMGSPRKPGDSMGSVLATGVGRPEWDAATITPAGIATLAGAAKRIIVKIDIEGGEYDLLPALAPLLQPATAAAVIAFHPRLLAGAGRTQSDIDAATKAALAAMTGFARRSLDPPEAQSVSSVANSTVLFKRV